MKEIDKITMRYSDGTIEFDDIRFYDDHSLKEYLKIWVEQGSPYAKQPVEEYTRFEKLRSLYKSTNTDIMRYTPEYGWVLQTVYQMGENNGNKP